MAKWKKTIEARFWEKVDRRGPDECWPWVGASYVARGDPRGQIWNGERVIPAPEMALRIAGRWREGSFALHKCNNSICVNERHLYAGSRRDNAQDSIAAGTFRHNPAPRGEKNQNAKLTASDIPKIRSARRAGHSYQRIGDMFGVAKETVRKVMDGVTWSHV